jgi:AcrR family transcriptional regulator
MGDKRARTRDALIKAAGDILREVGYERATLETIAARAGMTRGAIYGNFESRDELFAAVALYRWAPVFPKYTQGSSFRQHMRRLGKAYAQAARERAPNATHAAAFQLHMHKHPALHETWLRDCCDSSQKMRCRCRLTN